MCPLPADLKPGRQTQRNCDNSDAVVISLAISEAVLPDSPEAIQIEKYGKPCVLILAKAFQPRRGLSPEAGTGRSGFSAFGIRLCPAVEDLIK